MFQDFNEVLIHSGNMLDIDEIVAKTGLKSSEELQECIKIALQRGKKLPGEKCLEIYNITNGKEILNSKQLLTTVKVFLKEPTKEALRSAIDTYLSVLYNISLDSLIIWYPREMWLEPSDELLDLWSVLEDYVLRGKITRVGIADLETDVFMNLYKQVKVKPSIFHLNVKNCCIVPPDLQKFAEEKEIQLLTHYDPPDICPEEELSLEEFRNFHPYWILRYQSHFKCRGVLAKKGYLISLRQTF